VRLKDKNYFFFLLKRRYDIVITTTTTTTTTMYRKGQACFLFLDPQDEVGLSISSSAVLCWLKPRDPWAMQLKLQQTGEGAGGSPAPQKWAHSAKGAHPYRKACRSRGIKVAAPPLDLPCDRPVTCPGDSKILVKSSR
jgi:hypothetical protein